jgi:hypothetical protein
VKRALYVAAAMTMTMAIVGCGFSIGNDKIADDDLDSPEGNPRARTQDASTTANDGAVSTTNPTNPTSNPIDAGTTTPDTGAPPAPAGPLKAFVSSAIVTGGFGGLAGADKICNDLAKAQNLPGTYVAWVSTTGTNAIDRITANGPWQRVDGQVVAQTKAQLGTGALTTALRRDEKNQEPPLAEDRVWTATGADGKFVGGSDCAGWTGAGKGRVGEAEHANGQWTALVDEACTEINRVYCFQNQ